MNAAVSSAAKSGPCHVTAQVAAGAGRGGAGAVGNTGGRWEPGCGVSRVRGIIRSG